MRDLLKQRDELLSICAELQESAEYWSEYDVPLGIVERLTVAIASVKGAAINPASLLPDERECCGTFPRTPHRSTCKNYRGKKGGA